MDSKQKIVMLIYLNMKESVGEHVLLCLRTRGAEEDLFRYLN